MTNTKKILFSDLDGTLLSDDKTISPENLQAIKAMTDAGHSFVIATGRPLMSALEIAKAYHFMGADFYIASFNGGLIYDCNQQKEIYHEGIERKYVRFLFDEAKKRNLHVHTYSPTHVLAERPSEMLTHYLSHIHMPSMIVGNVCDVLTEDPLKVIIADLHDHEKLVRFQEDLRSQMDPVSNNMFSSAILLEYGSLKASKGQAIRILCKLLGIDISNSIACGDEENDISMLDAAGIGAVMKNGVTNAKSHGDYITRNDNNHHGIAEIIENFILK